MKMVADAVVVEPATHRRGPYSVTYHYANPKRCEKMTWTGQNGNHRRMRFSVHTAAGLPDDLQIRDLRRTGATEGTTAGATPAELMAVGGWADQASIRPYLVQTVEQAATFQAKRDDYRHRLSGNF
jgi:hypothetical protein